MLPVATLPRAQIAKSRTAPPTAPTAQQFSGEIQVLKAEKAALGTAVDKLEVEKTGVGAEIDSLRERKSSLEGEVKGLEDKNGVLEGELAGLEEKKSGLESELEGLQEKKRGLESEIAEDNTPGHGQWRQWPAPTSLLPNSTNDWTRHPTRNPRRVVIGSTRRR